MNKTKSLIQKIKFDIQYSVNELVLVTLVMVSSTGFSMAQSLSQNSFKHVNSPYDEQSPFISPDGKVLAFIARNNGKFQVATLDLATRQTQILTDSDKDESPSFAPNGRMILLATVNAGRGVLSAVSADGRIKQRLTISAGDVREPAWGPFAR